MNVSNSLNEKWFYSLNELRNTKFKDADSIIGNGVVVQEGITLIHGKPKTMKSFIALNIAVSLATGSDWVGLKVPVRKRVMYLQSELSKNALKSRLFKMTKDIQQDEEYLYFSGRKRFDFSNEKDIEYIASTITQFKVDVLIIDPLADYHRQPNENDNAQMAIVMQGFKDLASQTGVSIILIHHDGKDALNYPKIGGYASRGASSIFAAVDTDIQVKEVLKSAKKGKAQFNLHFVTRHAEQLDSLIIEFDSNTNFLRVPAPQSDIKTQKILQIIKDYQPVSAIDITNSAKAFGQGYGKSTIATELKKIIDSGFNVVNIRGKYQFMDFQHPNSNSGEQIGMEPSNGSVPTATQYPMNSYPITNMNCVRH